MMVLKGAQIALLRRLLAKELTDVAESTDYDYKSNLESMIVQLTLEEYRLGLKENGEQSQA